MASSFGVDVLLVQECAPGVEVAGFEPPVWYPPYEGARKGTGLSASSSSFGSMDSVDPRQGRFWVRKHSHEAVAPGDEPRPEGEGLARRWYFADLREGLEAWGRYRGREDKLETALRIAHVAAEVEATSVRECFFGFEDDVPGQYVAVVFANSGGAGRVWCRTTVIHTLTEVPGTEPITIKGAPRFSHHFADFVEKKAGTSESARATPLCIVTQLRIPLSGKCDCGSPQCEYSSP